MATAHPRRIDSVRATVIAVIALCHYPPSPVGGETLYFLVEGRDSIMEAGAVSAGRVTLACGAKQSVELRPMLDIAAGHVIDDWVADGRGNLLYLEPARGPSMAICQWSYGSGVGKRILSLTDFPEGIALQKEIDTGKVKSYMPAHIVGIAVSPGGQYVSATIGDWGESDDTHVPIVAVYDMSRQRIHWQKRTRSLDKFFDEQAPVFSPDGFCFTYTEVENYGEEAFSPTPMSAVICTLDGREVRRVSLKGEQWGCLGWDVDNVLRFGNLRIRDEIWTKIVTTYDAEGSGERLMKEYTPPAYHIVGGVAGDRISWAARNTKEAKILVHANCEGGAGDAVELTIPGAPENATLSHTLFAPPAPLAIRAAGITASSRLGDKYSPDRAFDGDYQTAWVEGATGPGKGEWVSIELAKKEDIKHLYIQAGYFKSPAIYNRNNRVRRLWVHVNGKRTAAFDLRDQHLPHYFEVDWPGARTLRFEIKDVYESGVDDDTCISEILLY